MDGNNIFEPPTVHLLLVNPVKWDEESDDWVSISPNEEVHKRRMDLLERMRKVLVALGCTTQHMQGMSAEGCNWEAKMDCDSFFLTADVVVKLEERLEEREALRKSAIAKLSVGELEALGVYNDSKRPERSRY